MSTQNITELDRKIWRRNALMGAKKWMEEPHKKRKAAFSRKRYTDWQFVGKSPNTKNVKHTKIHSHYRKIVKV